MYRYAESNKQNSQQVSNGNSEIKNDSDRNYDNATNADSFKIYPFI